ncbi:MAG: hypothetical protein PUE98_03725 [Galactobacillus timonensis]|uniref:hypothetical protein n=1 Tax=Galactobacillus timonensis TaxID=2041840 RepID=UPI00240A9B0A|nr:hypothetical protein [Galactobacillus timonensis]MDD6599557.1 hypothetical protein [Galactobacillus timonensis]
MTSRDIFPFINEFITVTLKDGSQRSGYVANNDAFRKDVDSVKNLELINGFFRESVRLEDIVSVDPSARDETISIPVVGLKDGYSNADPSRVEGKQEPEPLLRREDLVLYEGDIDNELSDLYFQYVERFHKKPDTKRSLGFEVMSLDRFKEVIRICLDRNEPVSVVLNSFVKAYLNAKHPDDEK